MLATLKLTKPSFFPANCLRIPFQVLQNDSTLGCLCLRNKLFTDYMIRVFLEFGLLAGEFSKTTLSRFSANALQYIPAFGVPLAVCFNTIIAEGLPVRITSDGADV